MYTIHHIVKKFGSSYFAVTMAIRSAKIAGRMRGVVRYWTDAEVAVIGSFLVVVK